MDLDVGAMLACHRSRGALVTIALREVDDPSAYGLVERDGTGRIVAFREKTASPPPGLNTINAGAYVMEPEVLDRIPAEQLWSNERDLFPALAQAGLLYGFLQPGQWAWFDTGTSERYLAAQRTLLERATQFELPAGVLPARIDWREPVLVDPSARVAPGAIVGPYAVIGPECTIEGGAAISDSAVWSGTTVGAGARVRGAIVGAGCMIGPDAQIGPGSVLADQTVLSAAHGNEE
jgi:NDP-sugar pyrophosphorylase family protein